MTDTDSVSVCVRDPMALKSISLSFDQKGAKGGRGNFGFGFCFFYCLFVGWQQLPVPAYSIKNIKHICNGQARKRKVGGEEECVWGGGNGERRETLS